jgi:hypothetical protein
VLKISGFNLTLTTKPLDKHLLNELPNIPVDETCYEYVKTEFEKNVCKIREGSIYAVLKSNNTYSFISHDACQKRFCDFKYFENGKKENFIKRWLMDENKKAFEDTDIYLIYG